MTGLSLGVFDDLYLGRVFDGVKADVGRFGVTGQLVQIVPVSSSCKINDL